MPRRRDHRRYVIYVVQMGAMRPRGDRIVDVVAEYLDAYYDSPAVVLPPVAVPAAAWDSERRQYDARAVLQALQRALPDDALGLVAVTEVDLFIPAVNYVFGLASFERQVSVVSLRRFGNDFRPGAAPGTVLRRALTVSSHEFGHILSMRHCTAFRCLMNGTNSLEDADRHSQHLCPQCVRKAHHALGFYRNDRYARLKYFYEKYGLAGEEEFVARRLDPPKVELVAAE
jgi:archaemetzincin